MGKQRFWLGVVMGLTVGLNTLSPSWAGDPFRTNNPRNINGDTEAAFRAWFQEGNYPEARRWLQQAEGSNAGEPMVYAMLAALAYTEEDWSGLDAYGARTIAAAQQLLGQDALRGHLYLAVGQFLQGAAGFRRGERVGILLKLQGVFQSLDQAARVAPNDPELNLLRGYMDLLVAVHLPFSNPEQTISRLQAHGAPRYLVDRAIAIAYRDLRNYGQALQFVDRALAVSPDNPDLLYLKAQILYRQGGNDRVALDLFNTTMSKYQQLPLYQVAQIDYERCLTENRIDRGDRDCPTRLSNIRNLARSR